MDIEIPGLIDVLTHYWLWLVPVAHFISTLVLYLWAVANAYGVWASPDRARRMGHLLQVALTLLVLHFSAIMG